MIIINNLHFSYTGELPLLFQDFSWEVPSGVIICLGGSNGSGKSTLIALISKRLKPLSGKIKIDGKTAYLSQRPINNLVPSMTINEHLKITKLKNSCKTSKYLELLLPNSHIDYNKQVKFLSGGQQQVLAIYLTIASDAVNILLDEPSSNLDNRTVILFIKLLNEAILLSPDRSIIIVSHDLLLKDVKDWESVSLDDMLIQ